MMKLDNDNFLEFAKSNYIHPSKTSVDFNEDLNRIMYIKKLFNRLTAGEQIDYKLIVNHIIILFNVFNRNAIIAMLFFKIEHELWGVLKTFLKQFGFTDNIVPFLDVSIKDVSIVDTIERDLYNVYRR